MGFTGFTRSTKSKRLLGKMNGDYVISFLLTMAMLSTRPAIR